MEPMMQAQRAQNPLFLRDAELERSLALLTLLQLELEAAITPMLDRQGIEPADALLLARVEQATAQGEPATAAELTTFLGWTKQRMSRRLLALVGRGLIERRPSPTDRRKQEVLSTALGSQQVATFKALQKRLLRRIFRRAGPAEVAGFQNVLAIAAQHVGRARQTALPGGTRGGASPALDLANGDRPDEAAFDGKADGGADGGADDEAAGKSGRMATGDRSRRAAIDTLFGSRR